MRIQRIYSSVRKAVVTVLGVLCSDRPFLRGRFATRPVRVLLAISLVLNPVAHFAQAQTQPQAQIQADLQQATAERAYLLDLRERVKDFMDINLNYVSNVKHCFKGELSNLNCEREKLKVKENIAVQYPIMRQYQLLKDILVGAPDEIMYMYGMHLYALRDGAKTEGSRFSLMRWISFEHPLDSLVHSEHLFLPRRHMTDEEAENVLNSQKSYIPGTLHPANLNGYMRWFCELAYGENQPDCENLDLRYSAHDQRVYFYLPHPEKVSVNPVVRGFLDPVYQAATMTVRHQLAEELLEKYYRVVQDNPYVALMGSAQPSDDEIIQVFTFMQEQAQAALRKYESQLIKLRRPGVTNEELRELLSYASIALGLVDDPGESMQLINFDYAQVHSSLSADQSNYELKKAALFILGNIAVCVGGGKIIKSAALAQKLIRMQAKGINLIRRGGILSRPEQWAKVFSPFCWGLTAVPVNLYFLGSAYQSYRNIYQDLFSNANAGSDLHKLHELSDAKRGIFWSIVLLPLGYKETLQALRASGIYVSASLQRSIKNMREAGRRSR